MKLNIEYYKNNMKRLEEIEFDLFKNIKKEVNDYFKNNNIKIYEKVIDEKLKLAFPYSLRMEDNNDFYFEKGTYLELEELKNIRVGIYWENVKKSVVDLDLNSMHLDKNDNLYKLGWEKYNFFIKKKKLKMIYSGDIRDGEHGASEFIEIRNDGELKYSIFSSSNFHTIKNAWYYAGIVLFDDEEDIKKYNVNNLEEILFNFNPDKFLFSFKNVFKDDFNTHVIFIIDYDENRIYPAYLTDKRNVLNIKLFKNYLNKILIEKDNLKINEIISNDIFVDENYLKDKEHNDEKIILNSSELVFELLNLNDK